MLVLGHVNFRDEFVPNDLSEVLQRKMRVQAISILIEKELMENAPIPDHCVVPQKLSERLSVPDIGELRPGLP